MNFKIESIFPTNFLTANLERDLTEEELKVINSIRDTNAIHENEGNIISSETYLFNECSELDSLKKFCLDGVKNFVNKCLKTPNNIEFYITQSWLNYTSKGQYHHRHAHPNSIISGVFYFKANPEVDAINFYKPLKEHSTLYLPVESWDWYNSDSWYFPVKTGDLIIFPSNLTHDVSVTSGDDVRISLAFNTFVRGFFGSIRTADALFLH